MDPNQAIKDEELVNDVLAGNTHAFNQLVTRYFGMVYLIGYARFRRRETGEDLAQETFLRAYLHLPKLNEPQLFPAWVCRIARNLATDWQRESQRVSQLLPMIPIEDLSSETPDTQTKDAREQLETSGQNKVVQEAILQLPSDLRELVLLYYSEGLNKEEIGRLLGMHPVQVGRQLKKALALLKGILEPVLRESIQPLRASQKATLKSIAIITAATALSASSKAAIIAATGEIVQKSVASLAQSTEGRIAKILKHIPETLSKGIKTTTIKKAIAITATAIAIIGAIYYFKNPKMINKDRTVEIKDNSSMEIQQNNSVVLAMVENHNRLLNNNPNNVIGSSQTTENQKRLQDYSGNYIFYGGSTKHLLEINRNLEGSVQIKDIDINKSYYGNNPYIITEQRKSQDNELSVSNYLWFYGNSKEANAIVAPIVVESDGKTLTMIEPITGKHLFNVGRRVEDIDLWTALRKYSKHDYTPAISEFRKYLHVNPQDVFIELVLADSLVEKNKLSETKLLLSNFEKNPEVESNWYFQLMVEKVRYLLTGKEKSLANQNVWDKYVELIDSLEKSYITETKIKNILFQHVPIGNNETQLLQEYIAPNRDVIQKFMKIPEKSDCFITNYADLTRNDKLMILPLTVLIYGRLQAEEGNIKEAIEAYRRIIRFAQQINHSNLDQNEVAWSIRQYGESGFESLLNEAKINNIEDAELVFKTIEKSRQLDPISIKDYGYEFTMINHYESWDRPSIPNRAHVFETKSILLEAAAALSLYHLQQGAYPAKIQDLIPKYLSSVPVDTFTHNPLKFIPTEQGLTVYSYGPDNTDDKGLLIYDPTNGIKSRGDSLVSIK